MSARYIVGTGLILGALVVISVITYARQAIAYYTVDELFRKAGVVQSDIGQRPLQVRGEVDMSTIERGVDGLEMRFDLIGQEERMHVIYHGMVPDTFEQAESVTVGGYLGTDGFVADELFVQCPSKYEAVPPGEYDHAGDDYFGDDYFGDAYSGDAYTSESADDVNAGSQGAREDQSDGD